MRFSIACVAALLSLAAACSDAPSSPPKGSQLAPVDTSDTLAGVIIASQTDAGSTILLLTAAADSVVLQGPVALEAAQAARDSQVRVTGVYGAPKVMYVNTYYTQRHAPDGCSPRIMSQPRGIQLPCDDGAAKRRR